jgi:3-oxoacyl-[acyl-carrier protein] reductase
MENLEGKTAFISGASQGIGRACALALARMGARVALGARNEAKLEAVAEEIVSSGGQAKSFIMDVSDETSIQAAAKAAIAHFGSVDILVNNAGITRDTLLLRMKRADWEAVMATNLTGAFLLTQALLNPMLRARWGRIINVSSVVGRVGQAGQANYAASKAGLIGFTRSMARELASRSITVNAIAPGYVETAMTAVLDAKQREAMLSHIPLGRPGSEQEVAHAVAFLASPEAGYITGHVLDVNGGLFMN